MILRCQQEKKTDEVPDTLQIFEGQETNYHIPYSSIWRIRSYPAADCNEGVGGFQTGPRVSQVSDRLQL